LEKDSKPELERRIAGLNPAERMMMALKGNREERDALVRDTNRVIWGAVLASPQMNELDVERISQMRDVDPDVLREIAKKREWIRRYAVRLHLVMNPLTPTEIALGLLSKLTDDDLRKVIENHDLPEKVRRAAPGFLRLDAD
jgi:hypothetical protein